MDERHAAPRLVLQYEVAERGSQAGSKASACPAQAAWFAPPAGRACRAVFGGARGGSGLLAFDAGSAAGTAGPGYDDRRSLGQRARRCGRRCPAGPAAGSGRGALRAAGIDPRERAERLAVTDFARLAAAGPT